MFKNDPHGIMHALAFMVFMILAIGGLLGIAGIKCYEDLHVSVKITSKSLSKTSSISR